VVLLLSIRTGFLDEQESRNGLSIRVSIEATFYSTTPVIA
jgi:hypothetical protein